MSTMQTESDRRAFLLFGTPFWVVFSVALPLLAQNCLQMVFRFFDAFTAANMSMHVVTTVAFSNDIKYTLDAIGAGLSVGVGIIISRSFGRNEMEEIRRQISTVFFVALFLVAALFLAVIPFSAPLLRLFSFPEELLASGSVFLSLNVVSLLFSFINTIFFATEKARGRTKIVMYGNLVTLIVKTVLNVGIVMLVSGGILVAEKAMYLLPVASCVSFGAVSVFVLSRMFSKQNIFRVSWKYTSFRKDFLLPLTKLSFPVFVERFLLYFGRVVCNGLFVVFGSIGVAAPSCAISICSLVTEPFKAFQDAESSIVATNLGNRNVRRSVSFIGYTGLFIFALGILLFSGVAFFSEYLIRFFAKGNEELVGSMRVIYHIVRWAALFDALDSIACGFLYACKKTRLPVIVNIMKLFVVRIPLFLFLTRVWGQGIEAVGWSIYISNGVDGLLSAIFVIYAIIELKRISAIEASNNEKLTAAITALGRWDAFDEHQANRHGISVPSEVLEAMREEFGGTLTAQELADAYKVAIVEARIAELEKHEMEQVS